METKYQPTKQEVKTAIRIALLTPLSTLSVLVLLMIIIPVNGFLPGASNNEAWGIIAIVFVCLTPPVTLALLYYLLRRKLSPVQIPINGLIAGIMMIISTLIMIISKGNLQSDFASNAISIISLSTPILFPVQFLAPGFLVVYFLIPGYHLYAFILSILFQKRFRAFLRAMPLFVLILSLVFTSLILYQDPSKQRYAGHGFDYMNGYSSTDFSDYMVYSSPSKLVSLDHPASLIITGEENMPKMDGAEACYPIYAAVAKAVYKDISQIEVNAADEEKAKGSNGKIVRFSNTVRGFSDLITKNQSNGYNVDLFFGARPSESQLESAQENSVTLTITPIGREAFVFFVEPDNPVTNLTSDQIRKIYSGKIKNWKEVGGKNQQIKAFQRPANSGSQTIMEYFMGDVPLKEPETYEMIGDMGGIVHKVAQYANEQGAFGYSFRYFVEDLMQENNVRVIAVDGVQPTIENIRNGSYPLTTPLCLITRENDPNPNVQKMIDFMLSPDGQEIIEKTGYAGLGK